MHGASMKLSTLRVKVKWQQFILVYLKSQTWSPRMWTGLKISGARQLSKKLNILKSFRASELNWCDQHYWLLHLDSPALGRRSLNLLRL